MPIYEYICEDCQNEFEKIVVNKQQEITCPKCASKRATIQLSVFSSAVAGGSAKSFTPQSSGGGGCCGGGAAAATNRMACLNFATGCADSLLQRKSAASPPLPSK